VDDFIGMAKNAVEVSVQVKSERSSRRRTEAAEPKRKNKDIAPN
jgi:hypothetical protein